MNDLVSVASKLTIKTDEEATRNLGAVSLTKLTKHWPPSGVGNEENDTGSVNRSSVYAKELVEYPSTSIWAMTTSPMRVYCPPLNDGVPVTFVVEGTVGAQTWIGNPRISESLKSIVCDIFV